MITHEAYSTMFYVAYNSTLMFQQCFGKSGTWVSMISLILQAQLILFKTLIAKIESNHLGVLETADDYYCSAQKILTRPCETLAKVSEISFVQPMLIHHNKFYLKLILAVAVWMHIKRTMLEWKYLDLYKCSKNSVSKNLLGFPTSSSKEGK